MTLPLTPTLPLRLHLRLYLSFIVIVVAANAVILCGRLVLIFILVFILATADATDGAGGSSAIYRDVVNGDVGKTLMEASSLVLRGFHAPCAYVRRRARVFVSFVWARAHACGLLTVGIIGGPHVAQASGRANERAREGGGSSSAEGGRSARIN